jgi:hypothetical protein
VSKHGDHLFSHWCPKQLEPDYVELTSSIHVFIGRTTPLPREEIRQLNPNCAIAG